MPLNRVPPNVFWPITLDQRGSLENVRGANVKGQSFAVSHQKVPAIILHQEKNAARGRNLLAARSLSLLAAWTRKTTHHRGQKKAPWGTRKERGACAIPREGTEVTAVYEAIPRKIAATWIKIKFTFIWRKFHINLTDQMRVTNKFDIN